VLSRRRYSQVLAAEKERLSALSAEELCQFPEYQSVRRSIDGTLINVSIWHHSRSIAGELIVAQAFCPWLSWFPTAGRMIVQGLVVQPAGQIRSAEEHELWAYM